MVATEKIDYKKEYKDLYKPKTTPSMIDVPKMNFIMISGKCDPNEEDGEYSKALGLLYALTFTIKMSKKSSHQIPGYFEYVVPPLEGFWWMSDGSKGVDYNNKSDFSWISVIRQPEFVNNEVFAWAKKEVERKKGLDTSLVRFEEFTEGLCVQCMHIGPYDEEPATVEKMNKFMKENNLIVDINDIRHHHEIYLSDPRRTKPENLKTVIRHPVKRK